MDITGTTVHGWQGLELRVADIVLTVTPEIGGRIMSLRYRGEELLYVHLPEKGKVYDLPGIADIVAFKKGLGFKIIGGDKTWVAPEKDWAHRAPPLDLDIGRWSVEKRIATEAFSSVRLISLVCRETGLQLARQVDLFRDGKIVVQEELFNRNPFAVRKGLWNVTQVPKPFEVYVRAELSGVRSYYHEDATLPKNDVRPQRIGDWVSIPASGDVCYKFGALLTQGRAVLVSDTAQGPVAWGRRFLHDSRAVYAHGSQVEVFNSAEFPYGELEVHSPFITIPSGGRLSAVQQWRLLPWREELLVTDELF